MRATELPLDKHAVRIPSLWEAKEHLAKIGVKYDRIIADDLISKNWYTGQHVTGDGIHQYFMQGDCDVACFTPTIGVLYVNDEPRQWCAEFLSKTHLVK